MKRQTVFLLAVTFLIGSLPVRAQTPEAAPVDILHQDRWAVITSAATAPSIDGSLDDASWSGAATLQPFLALYDQQPAKRRTDALLTYTDTHLYIGLRAHPDEDGSDAAPAYERVDIILSPTALGDGYFQISIELSNRRTEFEDGLRFNVSWGNSGSTHSRQDFVGREPTVSTSRERGIWTAEIEIPYSSLGVSSISTGEEWRLNVLRYREGDGPVSTWAPVRYSNFWDTGGTSEVNGETWKNYEVRYAANAEGRLGSIFFGAAASPVISSDGTRPPLERWDLDDIRLEYVSFTTKKLSFTAPDLGADVARLDIRLRFPTGREEAIPDHTLTKEGDRVVVRFDHPRPNEVGSYQLMLQLADAETGGTSRFAIVSFDDQSLTEAGDKLYEPPAVVATREVEDAAASEHVKRVLAVIPENVGLRFAKMPHNPLPRGDGVYEWSIEQPDLLVTADGTVYPNEDYPEDKSIVVTNALGEDVTYPYYEDEDGNRYFVTPHRWFKQRAYAIQETRRLADTDPLGAARLLHRWAQVYPHWVPVNDRSAGSYPVPFASRPPNPYWGGMWARWHMEELGIMSPLVDAFGIVRETNAFDLLEKETGQNVEHMLLDDVFMPTVEFMKQYVTMNHNMTPRTWRGLITLGRALKDPKFVHQAVWQMRDFISNYYLSDGFWREVALGYHNMSTRGLLQEMDRVEGWSDPPGYVSPKTGVRFDNLDLAEEFPGLAKSKDLTDRFVYPDGTHVPISDSRAGRSVENAIINTGSFHMPAAKLTKLQRGAGPNQHQVWLNFTPKNNHHQHDPLNLILYAEGQELLPDIGYYYVTHMQYFYSTFGHNTVVVNGRDTGTGGVAKYGGNIELFADVDELQIVQASQESGYAGITDVYMRQPWFVGFGAGAGNAGYLVDLFHVSGGKTHEYTVNFAANYDAELSTNINMTYYNDYYVPPGTRVVEPRDYGEHGSAEGHYYGYIYLEDVQRGEIEEGSYELELATQLDGHSGAGMKLFGFVSGDSNELYLGKAVSNRIGRTTGKNSNATLKSYMMPKYVVKRAGEDLTSTFATVLEPYSGPASKIDLVEQLETSYQGDVALKITYGDTTDYILSSPFSASTPLNVDDIYLEGKAGFIRLIAGRPAKMVLVGGTQLRYGDHVVTAAGPVEGRITRVLRKSNGDQYDALVTNAEVSDDLEGRFVVVTHPDGGTVGFAVGDAFRDDGETIIQLVDQDPGFEIAADGSSEQTFYPLKKWGSGDHRFRIENVVSK